MKTKKLGAFILSTALAVGAFSLAVMADGIDRSSEAIRAVPQIENRLSDYDNATEVDSYEALVEAIANANTDDTIVLTEDIEYTGPNPSPIYVNGKTITIALNKHTLSGGIDTCPSRNIITNEPNHIIVGNGASLTVTGEGLITGFCGQDGGAFDNAGTLVIGNGVRISGNYALNGGGISNSGNLTIHDSVITENEAWISCGGVSFNSGSVALGGSTVISGNVENEIESSNLFVYNGNSFTVDKAFTEDALIGVDFSKAEDDDTVTIGTFADGVENTVNPFVQDKNSIAIEISGSSVRVRDFTWSDLQAKFDQGGTIVLGCNVTAGENDKALEIKGKEVILDLNGYTLDRGLLDQEYERSWDNGCITVEENGSLTIRDSKNNTGKITGANGGSAIYVASSYFALEGGVICDNNIGSTDVDDMLHMGGGVYLVDQATFEMNGGIIKNNKALVGGGVCLWEDNNFVMNGGEISGNYGSDGGGVYIGGPDQPSESDFFVMNGGSITNNTAKGGKHKYGIGGGVCAQGPSDDYEDEFCHTNRVITLNGGSIDNNTADVGGGIFVQDASMEMNERAVITENRADGYEKSGEYLGVQYTNIYAGGGIHCLYAQFYMNGGTISKNSSGKNGGGLELAESQGYIRGGSISQNRCSGKYKGSGVYVASTGELHLSGGSITGNIVEVTLDEYNSGDYHYRGAVYAQQDYGIRVQGNPVIKDNIFYVNGVKSLGIDLLLADGQKIVVEGELRSDAEIYFYPGGVKGSQVTQGAADYCSVDPLSIFKCNFSTSPDSSDPYCYYVCALNAKGEVCSGFPAFVTYDLPGQSRVTVTVPDGMGDYPLMALPTETINGKVVYGWTYNGKTYVGGDTIAIPAAEIYPVITPPKVTIGVVWGDPSYWTVNFDKGSSKATGTINPVRVEKGEAYTLPECGFTAPSYMTFDKWKIGDEYYEAGASYVPKGDEFTLVAQWKPIGPIAAIQVQVLEAEDNVETTIVLDSDAIASAADSVLIIPHSKNIVLDLNGHTIDRGLDRNSTKKEPCIKVLGNLTIIDSGNGGTITGGNASGIFVGDGNNAASLTINGGSIEGNYTAEGGGGVYCNSKTTFTMNGGEISDNTALGNGGGVFCNGIIFDMNAGSISGNTAVNGGGVYLYNGGGSGSSLTMKGGAIFENQANEKGGGVYLPKTGSVFSVMGSACVSGNTAAGNVPSNVYANTITVIGALTDEALIGVYNYPVYSYMNDADENSCTSGLSGKGSLANFSSDLDEYFFILTSDGEAKLAELVTKLEGYSLTLDGSIGVNFYMSMPDEIAADTTTRMQFTVGSGTPFEVTVNAKTETVGDKKYYTFTCPVVAKQMNDEITAQLFVGGTAVGGSYSFTVRSYAEYIMNNEAVFGTKAANLAKAMLSYGCCAQKFFGTSPATLDTSCIDQAALDQVTAEAMKLDVQDALINIDALSGVTFEGATLSLKSETTLSLYFSSAEELTFTTEDTGVVLEPAKVGTYKVIRIRGINAANIGDSFTVTVKSSSGTGTIKYSAMNYCYNVVTGEYDADLKNAVKALYLYYKAADQYLSDNG